MSMKWFSKKVGAVGVVTLLEGLNKTSPAENIWKKTVGDFKLVRNIIIAIYRMYKIAKSHRKRVEKWLAIGHALSRFLQAAGFMAGGELDFDISEPTAADEGAKMMVIYFLQVMIASMLSRYLSKLVESLKGLARLAGGEKPSNKPNPKK